MTAVDRAEERRRFYRINDVVMLRFEILDGPDGGDAVSGSSSLEINTLTLLREIDRELNQAINTVWQEHPAVAQALGLLNRKVSVIAAEAMEYEQGAPHSYDEAMVNLSGCGIAFESANALEPGTRLRLSVVLKPSQVTLSIAGTVVDCEERLNSEAMPFWVRVGFDDDAMAQEQLIQHVVQKQGALLSEAGRS
jgi:hypothetical protein